MKLPYFTASSLALAIAPMSLLQANELNPDISLVLDGYYKQNPTALSHREEGFGLGHTELSLSSPIDDLFEGRLTAVLEDHEGETELELEEAFIQTTAMPWNLSVRGGRFLSQVGYLNSRHLHEDDFVERPVPYRAMLGSHYFDDGLRVNLLMPTPFYWQIGAEAFDGNKLSEGDEDIGVYTLNTRFGGISPSPRAGRRDCPGCATGRCTGATRKRRSMMTMSMSTTMPTARPTPARTSIWPTWSGNGHPRAIPASSS